MLYIVALFSQDISAHFFMLFDSETDSPLRVKPIKATGRPSVSAAT